MNKFYGKKVYISSNTYFMFELESVNGISFEGLEQMSRVTANIYHTIHTLCPT